MSVQYRVVHHYNNDEHKEHHPHYNLLDESKYRPQYYDNPSGYAAFLPRPSWYEGKNTQCK